MKEYEIRQVDIDRIKDNPSQADSRVEPGKAMSDLIASLKEHSLLYPGLATEFKDNPDHDVELVDGHRRKAALKVLGFKKMPVIIIDTETKEIDPSAIFAQVSRNQQKTSTIQLVETYLKGGIVYGPIKSCIKNLDENVGREFLVRLVAAQKSPAIWNDTLRVIKFCANKLNRETHLKKVIEYLFKFGTNKVRAFMLSNGSPDELVKAIQEDRLPKF